MKQHEIILRFANGDHRYISDMRGHRASYASFDVVSRDQHHTIAPNRAHALEVAKAYREYAAAWPVFAVQGTPVIKPVTVGEVEQIGAAIAARCPDCQRNRDRSLGVLPIFAVFDRAMAARGGAS